MTKKLKDLLKESNVWDRKFGEKLPTLADTTKAYAEKNNIKEASTSESYQQMRNMLKNGLPMIFPREECEIQRKYYDKVMNNGDFGVFIQAIQVGDPKAIKLWPTVEKVIKKNIDAFYKEDIMIKQKLNTERNKMLGLLSKYGKKLKV